MKRKPITPEMEQRLATKSEESKAATLRAWGLLGYAIPGLVKSAVRFTKAAVRHVSGGMKKPPPEEIERRRSICHACPNFKASRCTICLCVINAKTSWALEQCPDDPPRWEAYLNDAASRASFSEVSKKGTDDTTYVGFPKTQPAADETAMAAAITTDTTDSSRPMDESSKSVLTDGPRDQGHMVADNGEVRSMDQNNSVPPVPPEEARPGLLLPPGAADNQGAA